MLTIDKLLQPISPEQPCGMDLAFSDEIDLIARARLQDDPALDQGVWVTTLRQADWPYVAQQCAALIGSRSKDMRLAVWLAEALAMTQGARGLGDGYALLAGLCAQFWDGLYPLAEDGDCEQRCGNLRWLLMRTPALLQQAQQTHGVLPASEVDYCSTMLQQLERVCDAQMGCDGPSFAAARESLALLNLHERGPARTDSLAGDAAIDTFKMEDVGSVSIRSRQQALAELRRIAAYFRMSEPHSPVAYLADKAAHWGELSLHDWLQEVVRDSGQLSMLEDLLGITHSG